MSFKFYIGIDPDIKKSGFAVWDAQYQKFEYITSLSFWDMYSTLSDLFMDHNIYVVIDAGWLRKKSNFHNRKGQTKQAGEKIAEYVGRNHQIGILIQEYCKNVEIPYELNIPSGKINAETFKNITKYTEITNQDQRDAAMLVFQRKNIRLYEKSHTE